MFKFKFILPLVFLVVSSYAAQIPSEAQFIKAAAPTTTFSFNVWLNLRNKQDLDQLVQEVYDPNSPRYQQFLTKARYEEHFAPSKEAEKKVSEFFIDHGMQAQIVNHNIRVRGSMAQIEQALHVQINYYRYKNKVFQVLTNAPKLTPDIAPFVADISGLATYPEFEQEANIKANNTQGAVHDLHLLWDNFIPAANPTDISLQGFSGANLQKTYNLNNIPKINGVRLNGAGQSLVVVDKCGTNGPDQILSDANQYFKMNQITPFVRTGPTKNFTIINPDGTPFTDCPNASSFSREIVLDIEASHTIAPGGNTVLVLGTDQRSTLMDVIQTLINESYSIGGFDNAYVISNSWSSPETQDVALETRLQLAAAAGISVNFSSGDCGDNTYTNAGKCNGSWPSAPMVDYPSSSAFVTAVGATALFVDNNYRYAFETVWGAVKTVSGVLSYTGGTGGGISQFYGPVAWQSAISSFTAGGYGQISTFSNYRAIPDIAMLGDPGTGLLIIANGSQVQDGGTSLACPLFSATLLLVNQARSLLNKGTPIGQAAPYLYQQNNLLLANRAINLIIPPSLMISGATPPPATLIHNTPAPASSFTIGNVTFGWDSSLTLEPESQFWNDGVGVGSPNIPNFVITMANM